MQEKIGNVKVVCRFRPLNEREKALSNSTVHELLDDKTVSIRDLKIDKVDKNGLAQTMKFSFDKVFNVNSTQEEVYTYAAGSVIESVIEGFNGTIFAYGQTSSGKTHTMEGQIGKDLSENSGIIPRMIRQVFSSISKCTENVEFRIKVSMVQLYMQKLRDLLDTNKNDLKIRSDKKKGIFIQNLSELYISTPEEVYQYMEIARKTRAIAATNMNERSSRSHMLFILTISQSNLDDMSAKTGKLYLVDLAGSEKIGKTGAEGKILDEAKKINISLTALGKVINALTDGKSTHIPYRDSKLTRVLQESLGGNSKTSLIVTCSPHLNNVSQTISTLRFGVSAKKIKNKPKINKEMTLAELQNNLDKLQKELIQRDKYINQLKNYIVVDLKQKAAPQFKMDSAVQETDHDDTDLVGELTKQLEIERNLNLVQEEELNNFKEKYEKILTEKQNIENQLADQRRNSRKLSIIPQSPLKNIQNYNEGSDTERNNSIISIQELLREISELENGNVIEFLEKKSNLALHLTQSKQYTTLLLEYEDQKLKRQEADEKLEKQEKTMQKKLSQLQNNICQLTHSYYDLLIIQQRHKVDNIFLKKKMDEKDVSILSLKQKIKDLQDQNRQLQDQRWMDDEQIKQKKPISKFLVSEEQQSILNDYIMKQGTNNPKVVKVVKPGMK